MGRFELTGPARTRRGLRRGRIVQSCCRRLVRGPGSGGQPRYAARTRARPRTRVPHIV